jgi:hypothetical protein
VTKDSLPFLMSSICSPYLDSTSTSSSAFPRCPIIPIHYLIFYFPAITSSSVAFFPSSFHLPSSIPFPHFICCLAVVMRHVDLVHFTLSYHESLFSVISSALLLAMLQSIMIVIVRTYARTYDGSLFLLNTDSAFTLLRYQPSHPIATSTSTSTGSGQHGQYAPTLLEARLRIPAGARLTLSINLDKRFLRYTEHPPDAQRGWDLPGAVFVPLPLVNSSDSGDMII